jgi:hypothetical protein
VVAGDHKVTALMETQRLDQQDPGAVEGAGDAEQAGRGQPMEAAAPVRGEREPADGGRDSGRRGRGHPGHGPQHRIGGTGRAMLELDVP